MSPLAIPDLAPTLSRRSGPPERSGPPRRPSCTESVLGRCGSIREPGRRCIRGPRRPVCGQHPFVIANRDETTVNATPRTAPAELGGRIRPCFAARTETR
jgi:hypothetical protein